MFATLRGPFFAIGDEELLDWAYRFGRQTEKGSSGTRSIRIAFPRSSTRDTPPDVEHLRPIADALQLLQALHRHRNSVFADSDDAREWGGASGVLHELLRATRAHVGFALRIGGEQALANVLHVAELARQYELGGGISFRGFVEELRVAADTAQAAEAPILEEGSDGVRMMTVHKAKGLEFPVVILADLTCKLSRAGGRPLDRSGRADCARSSSAAGRRPICCCTTPRSRRAIAPKASASPTSPPPARATCWSCRRSATRSTTAAGSIR